MSGPSETATESHLQPEIKPRRRLLPRSPKVRAAIGIAVILFFVVFAFLGPREGESDNVTGDQAVVPTVSVTHLVETAPLNHTIEYGGVQITLSKSSIAQTFSDDRKRAGKYTLRVEVRTKNPSQAVLGVAYADVVRLVPAHGTAIAPKLVSIKPEEMPNGSQTGFFDFPLAGPAPLATFSLQFGSHITVPLGS